MSTTVDSQRSGRSGIMPLPITSAVTTTDQSTQTGSSNTPIIQSTNFIYIYSFLSTLFLLLCLAILVLLRALIRRRRLDRHFNSEAESSDNTAQAAQRRRRQKKRPPIGSKPYMSDAWIGNGPVPTSLSTEALLETIQPFSITRTPEGTTPSNRKEKPVETAVLSEVVEQLPNKRLRRLDFFSYGQMPSSSSCGAENEKSAVNSDNGHSSHTPTSPSITTPISPKPEVEQLRIGFLIAMPRQRSRLGGGSSSSCLPASASMETPGRNFDTADGDSFAHSRWTDHLCEGELPSLSVGISTVYVPVDSPAQER